MYQTWITSRANGSAWWHCSCWNNWILFKERAFYHGEIKWFIHITRAFHNLNGIIAIDEMCFNIDQSRSIVAVILTNIQHKFLAFIVILCKEQPIHKPHLGAFMHIEVNFNKIEHKYGFEWDIHNSNYVQRCNQWKGPHNNHQKCTTSWELMLLNILN